MPTVVCFMHLTTGIDLVEVKRMKTAVERWGERLLNRVFTPQEIEYSTRGVSFYPLRNPRRRRGIPETTGVSSDRVYQHLAGRFAAKEATIKCLGEEIKQRPIGWKDIEIVNNSEGKPEIRFNQKKWRSKKRISLTISHTKDYAVAQAIAYN